MKSMTGFSSAEKTTPLGHLRIEIRSVNQKGLDVQWRMPRCLQHLEGHFGRLVRQNLSRGRVWVTMNLELSQEQQNKIVLDVAQTENIVKQLGAFAALQDSVADDVRTGDLLRFTGVWQTENVAIDEAALKEMAVAGLVQALEGLNEQRQREGEGLQQVIESHLQQIGLLVQNIDKRQSLAPEAQFQLMRERLSVLMAEQALSEDRLLQEAAHLADRLDVSEEINRLLIHIDHVKSLMKQVPVGRKLDFMCQEFIREANTVGSKCHDAEVAHMVVDLKAEVEKMREQVQNIE